MRLSLLLTLHLFWSFSCIPRQAQPGSAPSTSPSPAVSASPFAQTRTLVQTPLEVGEQRIRVELACTRAEQMQGLMFRESLPENEGMLFIFSQEQTLAFWMKNTLIPLDIAYLDSRGEIVDIQSMEPRSLQTHPSKRPAQYALEMNAGWFAKHDVTPGTLVNIPSCP